MPKMQPINDRDHDYDPITVTNHCRDRGHDPITAMITVMMENQLWS